MAAASRPELRVSPGLKRLFDYFAYAVTGLVLAGGTVYGLQSLQQPAATIPQAAPAAAVAAAPASPPPAVTAPAAAPAAVAANSGPAAGSQAAPGPAAGPYSQPKDTPIPPVATVTTQDKATFFALQRNCYDAAANNQNGEYPALQAAACNRYTQFANERGWDPGTLPAYGQAAPQAPAPAEAAVAAQPAVQDQPPQVIILDQNYDRDRYGDGHRHHSHDQSGNTQPQQQIGPNYALPHPQQPPPVSQQQPHNQMRPVPRPQN